MNERSANLPIRVGLVGLGRRGLFHLERWADSKSVRVIAASDTDPVARAIAATVCDRVETNPETLLADCDVDAVVLAVPTTEQARIGQQVLAAGKHLIFVEPRIASTVDEAAGLFDVAASVDRRIVVWAPWRDSPDFQEAFSVARSGVVGALRFLRFERWSAGSATQTEIINGREQSIPRSFIAVLDQLMALAGTAPVQVYARAAGGGRTATVTFSGMLTATITLQTQAAVNVDLGWAFDGERGGYASRRRWVRTADGEIYDVPVEPAGSPTLEGELRSMLAGAPPTIDRTESLHLVALLDAVERSVRSGRAADVELTR